MASHIEVQLIHKIAPYDDKNLNYNSPNGKNFMTLKEIDFSPQYNVMRISKPLK